VLLHELPRKRGTYLQYSGTHYAFYLLTRIRSVEHGICPTAAQAVTLRLTRTSVSGHIGVYYAEKVAQYAQNPEVKCLTYEDFEILRTKCIEVTTLTFQGHVTSSVT